MAHKILCIEDDRFIGEMYQRSLVKAGYDIEVVPNGPEGLKKAQTGIYDYVLLDLMLPEKTGVEILQELRGKEGNKLPNSKILVLTNFDQDEDSRTAMERLADGYLIKADLTPRMLVEIIGQMSPATS
ncbi:response regulator [Candidatus Saccharibacteria bacterium CPR2]|nr:response regulator [Candidatus Saccharibacteria bacterium CPR2]